MAGIRVVVCLPAEASADPRGAIAEALEPFRLMYVPQWRGIWDWWTVRGGSDGSGFVTLPGHEDDTRLIHDDPGYDGEPLPSRPGMCSGGPRRLLDLSGFREMSRKVTALGVGTEGRRLWQPDVLTLDGWWIEDGLYPRHGVCDAAESCPHMATGWQYQGDVGGYLHSLADEVLLVKLKCHG